MFTQVINLGTLKFGKPHRFSTILKNGTSVPIRVVKVSVGCTSCTKATMSKNTVGVSEEAEVDITFTPGVLGEQRKSVTLYLDKGSSYRIEFTANVED